MNTAELIRQLSALPPDREVELLLYESTGGVAGDVESVFIGDNGNVCISSGAGPDEGEPKPLWYAKPDPESRTVFLATTGAEHPGFVIGGPDEHLLARFVMTKDAAERMAKDLNEFGEKR